MGWGAGRKIKKWGSLVVVVVVVGRQRFPQDHDFMHMRYLGRQVESLTLAHFILNTSLCWFIPRQ